MEDRWLSVDEIADYLGVAKDTIYTWVTAKGMLGTRLNTSGNSKKKTLMHGCEPGGAASSSDDFDAGGLVVNKQRSDQENDKMNDQDQVSKAPECALEEGDL